MNCKVLWGLLYLTVAAFCWVWGYGTGVSKQHPEIQCDTVLIVKDSIIRDSIFIENQIIKEKIKYVEKEFSKEMDSVNNLNDTSMYNFFTEYISDYTGTTSNCK